MKLYYLSLISFLLHCSNDVVLSKVHSNQSFGELSSEVEIDQNQENNIEYCEDGEICSVTETFMFDQLHTNLDILVVMDVSSSMKKNLEKFGSDLKPLLSHVADFNWQMAFTTADHGDHKRRNGRIGEESWKNYDGDDAKFGRLMNLEHKGRLLKKRILTKTTPSLEEVFQDTITINRKNTCSLPPGCQGDHEQPLRVLKSAFEREENDIFFRSDADLVVIVITNEDERAEDPESATTAREVVNTFNSQFSEEKNLYGFGILVTNKSCYKKQRSGYSVQYGKRVGALARITGGENIDICQSDYGEPLRKISRLIREKILDHVRISTAFPDPNSIQVRITPEQNVRWKIEGRYILFTPSLKIGTKVEAKYKPR